MTSYRWFRLSLLILALVALVACTTEPKSATNAQPESAPTKTAAKVPQAITASQALQKMEGYAQKQWAQDAMPLHIESDPNSEANGQDGKSTVWMAGFGSMRKGEIRTFHWSGSLDPSAPVAGVSAAGSLPLNSQMASQLFQSFLVKADTDKAATIAVEHGG